MRGLTLATCFGSNKFDDHRATSGAGETNVFNGFGTLSSRTSRMAGISRTLAYQYDLEGNRTRVTHPDGYFFQYGFDGLNRFNALEESSAANPSASTTSLLTVGYRPGGGRLNITRTGGATTTIDPDNALRLESFTQSFANSANNLTNSFQYNPASQVTTLTQSNTLYTYSEFKSRVGTYVPNGLNQYTNVDETPLGYDLNGNLLTDGTGSGQTGYTYDMENHLVAMSGTVDGQPVTASLVYDVLGRLSQTTINGATSVTTQLHYDGDALIGEYEGGALTKRYVHGDQVDEPLVQYSTNAVSAATRRFLQADHQGSIIAHSNSSGTAVQTNSYDSYGIAASTNDGRFGYTGQTWLRQLGLNYYKARVYSPRLGRFLQTDPIFYGDNMNLYAYVGSDPFNRIDPPGLWSTAAHNRLISNTFSGKLNPASVARIQAGSVWADKGPNQAGARSFMHSMSDRVAKQSAADAKALSTAYVNQALTIARELVDQGKIEQAEFVFGAAMHTIMDGFSPEHTDAQGDPIPWWLPGFVPHGWGDSNYFGDFPGCNECRRDLTPQSMFGAGFEMYSAYVGVFGDPAKTPTVTIEECTEDSPC